MYTYIYTYYTCVTVGASSPGGLGDAPGNFEGDFPFPQVGYVSSLEGTSFRSLMKNQWQFTYVYIGARLALQISAHPLTNFFQRTIGFWYAWLHLLLDIYLDLFKNNIAFVYLFLQPTVNSVVILNSGGQWWVYISTKTPRQAKIFPLMNGSALGGVVPGRLWFIHNWWVVMFLVCGLQEHSEWKC